ncbi:MAG: response regulator [Cytophagaceae bacterium]|nr:response regulator [Cytophagaceae bacterium]
MKNILLIEDDQVTNYINKKLINRINLLYQVDNCPNGFEGLNYMKNCLASNAPVPQLILLDINMPVMDGFEFLEEFQKLNLSEKVIIVMLTTSSHIRDMDKLFQSGNSHLIAKPLTEEKFISILDKYFNNHSYGQTA